MQCRLSDALNIFIIEVRNGGGGNPYMEDRYTNIFSNRNVEEKYLKGSGEVSEGRMQKYLVMR